MTARATLDAQYAAWLEAADTLGLEHPSFLRGLQLDGSIAGLGVRVEERSHKSLPITRIVVQGEAYPVIRSIEPRKHYVDSLGAQLTGGEGVATGDTSFDRRVIVRGDAEKVAALLDAPTRHAIGRGVHLADGILTRTIPRRIGSAKLLARAVRTTVALAQRLMAECDVPAQLAANARNDPVGGVRLRSLAQLIRTFPEKAQPVLRSALRDHDPAVRLCAALALKEKAQGALRSLAKCQQLDEKSQVSALSALRTPLLVRQAVRVLDMALGSARHTVAVAAVRMLGQRGGAGAVARLTALLADEDAQLVLEACAALGATRDAAAAPALIHALGSPWPEVRVASATALGAVGAATAVAPLHAAAAAHPLLRRAASAAIAAIQSRIKGAELGQLSLAEGGSGQLSIGNDVPGGHVSLASTAQTPSAAKPKRS